MIYIVIPVFNRKKFTHECLLSLRKQTYQEFKTIVVDDGSTDGTEEMLKNDFPEVIIIKGDGNLWWTKATNWGIEYALKDSAMTYILTLNNDTVAPVDFLEKLMQSAKEKPLAIFGANPDKQNTSPSESEGKKTGLKRVSHLPGRGCLIPKEVFEKIGLFDEKRFPHYLADYDFTLTAHKNGFEVFLNYDAVLYTYPDESGNFQNRKKKTWKNYYNHLFHMRGGGNLKDFTNFELKHTPTYKLPYKLTMGYLRRLIGYWIK
ncbi:MAG: hypothetical protein OHK0057_35900 [Thermoflexibacter sp.]